MSGAPAASDGLVARLRACVEGETDVSRRREAFVLGLAEIVKATSNDQNVQRLAREIRASVADLAAI